MVIIVPVKNKTYIKKIGNVSFNNSQGGMVYSVDGLFPTICAGTHGYAMGYIMEELQQTNNKIIYDMEVLNGY